VTRDPLSPHFCFRIMFAVDDIDDVVARLRSHDAELVGEIAQYEGSTGSASCVALRGSSSDWPSGSAKTAMGAGAGPVRHRKRRDVHLSRRAGGASHCLIGTMRKKRACCTTP
jgi:hypothetical protein